MKKINLIVIISICLAFSTALVLHFISSDYDFNPQPIIVKNDDPTIPPEFFSPEVLAENVRSTGTIEPGNVEVQALFMNLLMDTEHDLVFQLAFNTHSVNLTDYDIAKEVYLENSKGIQIKTDFTLTKLIILQVLMLISKLQALKYGQTWKVLMLLLPQ